jgi:hypothetical protein
MYRKLLSFFLLARLTLSACCSSTPALQVSETYQNNIPARLQWNENAGYCGEVSLISAGLYYGQYLSQYDARAIATQNAPQNKGQLLLGKNDTFAASQMHLNAIEWDTESEQNTDAFLVWIKQNVVKGYPVAIGVYTNEYLFYGKTDPDAGDSEYDHIVPVTGIRSSHDLNDPSYFGDDVLYFSDNGLWGNSSNPPYHFHASFDGFQASRKEANAKNSPVYSLSDNASNYGIAITGIIDLNHDTVPVRIDTNFNYEKPDIQNKSSTRPDPMQLILTITVSNLEPGIAYNLYRYDTLASVPHSDFNAHAHDASACLPIQITSGTTYTMTEQIQSDETVIYRAVKASAP